MQSLLQNLMMKFIRLKYLTKDSTAVGLHTFKGTARKNKALNKIKVGTKVKCLFAEPNLLPSEKQKKKKKKKKKNQRNCLRFYVSSVSYLQSQLPFDNSFLKHA